MKFQLKFLMRNLKNILKIIWDDRGSGIANVIWVEAGMEALPTNLDDWLQNPSNKTCATGAETNQSGQNRPTYI